MGVDVTAQTAETEGARILVADDNPMVLTSVRALLEVCGHRADGVDCGTSALELALRGRYDGLVLDVQMPGLEGPDVALAVRAAFSERAAPWMIAMSADDSAETRAGCRRAGMVEFLSKPVRLLDLERILRRVIPEGPRVLRPRA